METLLEKKPENEDQKMFTAVPKTDSHKEKSFFEKAKGFFQYQNITSLEKKPENEGQKMMFTTVSETDSNKEKTFFLASKLGQVEYKFAVNWLKLQKKMEKNSPTKNELQDLLK